MVFTTVENTKRTYHSAIDALIEGSILAVAVVFLFLRDWRATAISALAIPLSAIPTFAFMSWMGFTLNSITLLALSLVAGVLVDDAIVEIENIVRHMRMGKTPYQAALDAADEIGLAVVATSATIIAVFLPVSFMGGITGQYFKQFGLTVAAAVFFSLLVARLVTPVIAAFTLKPLGHEPHLEGPLMTRYLGWLRTCVRHRWWTLLAAGVFCVASVAGLMSMSQTFFPPDDFASSQINVELPPGVRLEDTARISAEVTRIVRSHKEVTDVVESIGSDEDGQVRSANIFISLVPRSQRAMSQKEWEDAVLPELRKIPDARVQFQSQNGGGGGRDVSFYITGDDPVLAEASAHRVVEQMRGLKELRDPRIDGDLPRPELVVKPRFDQAAELGVTVQAISQTIRIATLGDIPQNVAKFSLSDRQVPIRVSLKRVLAPGSGDDREHAGADVLRRQRAAQGGSGHQLRSGPGHRAPLQPDAPPDGRRRPRTGRAVRRRAEEIRGAAGDQEPAAGRPLRADRHRRVYAGAVHELRARDRRRRADGVRGAGAAVRAGVPAADDPVGAAARARRRGRGARCCCGSRSRCRS